jgi:hypothetical protein
MAKNFRSQPSLGQAFEVRSLLRRDKLSIGLRMEILYCISYLRPLEVDYEGQVVDCKMRVSELKIFRFAEMDRRSIIYSLSERRYL